VLLTEAARFSSGVTRISPKLCLLWSEPLRACPVGDGPLVVFPNLGCMGRVTLGLILGRMPRREGYSHAARFLFLNR